MVGEDVGLKAYHLLFIISNGHFRRYVGRQCGEYVLRNNEKTMLRKLERPTVALLLSAISVA